MDSQVHFLPSASAQFHCSSSETSISLGRATKLYAAVASLARTAPSPGLGLGFVFGRLLPCCHACPARCFCSRSSLCLSASQSFFGSSCTGTFSGASRPRASAFKRNCSSKEMGACLSFFFFAISLHLPGCGNRYIPIVTIAGLISKGAGHDVIAGHQPVAAALLRNRYHKFQLAVLIFQTGIACRSLP